MTVWNGLENDARVVREATTLHEQGARVRVICTKNRAGEPTRSTHPNGFAITALAPRPQFQATPGRLSLAGKLTRRARSIFWRLRVMLAMTWAALRQPADIYHGHDFNGVINAGLAALLKRRPFIYDAHEINLDREGYSRLLRGVVKFIEGFFIRRAKVVITTTMTRGGYLAQTYGVDLPVEVQNRALLPETLVVKKGTLRQKCGLGPEVPIVLYQGGMTAGRGLSNMIYAAGQIPEAAFVFVGSGVMVEGLKAYAAEHGFSQRVHFIPRVPFDQLYSHTCDGAIGLQVLRNTCFNHWSTDSNKLFEYLVCGVPVIASDFPEIRKVVEQYDLGVLVDPEDREALVTAIRELLADDPRRARYISNAAAVLHELGWQSQEANLVGAYEKAMSE